ncbi:MAG: hypothetical protein H7Y07_00345 [Pyrinomonadaceae bacterium]|nr:hypothetical protein [Sphingobacteriaceae bacterium]
MIKNKLNQPFTINLSLSIVAMFISLSMYGQVPAVKAPDTVQRSPRILPGKGLEQHDFFYAGENPGNLSMHIVEKGKVTWSYTHPGKGEISDAILLSNGDILFAHQFGVTKISRDKKVLWNYDAPARTEIHTAQAIGTDRVLFVQNGSPAKVIVINIKTGKTEKEFEIPVAKPDAVHGQFRRARLTEAGTLLVSHMDLGKVAEYNSEGKEIWSTAVPLLWSAIPLKNGNILISSEKKSVAEINRKGDTIWRWTSADLPGYTITDVQVPLRLNNGNTIINNWAGKGNGTHVQFVEVDKNKKIVWALRSWEAPAELGRSTTIQVLDKKSIPENVKFGSVF